MRVLWLHGHPYPVSSHPRGFEDPGTHWHVQTPDGEWHAVLPHRAGDEEGDAWGAVAAAVVAWLKHRSEGRRDMEQ